MTEDPQSDIALSAEGVSFAYRRGAYVLKDISLALPCGRMTMMMGPSGAGKTTLLKVLAGILKPQQGRVAVFGHDIAGRHRRGLYSLIGYIPQQLGLVRNMTALENVLMGALGRCGHGGVMAGIFPSHEVEQAEAALDLMGIADKRDEDVFRLSGGQRQRVAIARTLLQRPRVVLADELVSDLDRALAEDILQLLRRSAERERMTFLINMHRAQLARDYADQVLMLDSGAVVRRIPERAPDSPGPEVLQ